MISGRVRGDAEARAYCCESPGSVAKKYEALRPTAKSFSLFIQEPLSVGRERPPLSGSQFVREQGMALEYSAGIVSAKGVSEGGKIKLVPGQSSARTVATLEHELVHKRLDRARRRASTTESIHETEAEAVRFVVCQAIGLETGTASADCASL